MFWTDLSSLNRGTDRQRDAYLALIELDLFSVLADFDPMLTGTFPLSLDTAESDLDVACCAPDLDQFHDLVADVYGTEDDFFVRRVERHDLPTLICNFRAKRFAFEIFAQHRPVEEQHAYKHMVAEARLLREGGDEAVSAIRRLQEQGIKTEPAFGRYFCLDGDPEMRLAELADATVGEISEVVVEAKIARRNRPEWLALTREPKHCVTVSMVNPYDAVPYPDLSNANTHPDRLATMARLLGLTPAPVERCRVLEIGCAAGGNLLPMAYALPHAEFVGIDYSAIQIQEGQARIQALGLHNLTLICGDLRDVGAELGEFDYFIAHGVYSWTSAEVRDSLLALCKRVLRPDGIAYVSYNTYPGWRITSIIRDAMLYHGRNATTPAEKVDAARTMLDALVEHATEPAYAGIFRSYAAFLGDGLKGRSDAFLLHDELEEVNDPVYFYQFVEHVQRHGLAYLVEAELHDVLPSVFRPEAQATLQELADDAIALEQYMDFLRNRMFRQTLLCHAEVPTQRMLRPEPVMASWVRSTAVRADPPDDRPTVAVFKTKGDATIATDHPLTIAAMDILIQSAPHTLAFADLVKLAQAVLPAENRAPGPVPEELVLAANLLRAHGQSDDLVSIHSYAPSLPVAVSERPEASAVARFQSQDRELVTNLWHQRVTLQPRQRELLALLDGSHRVDELPSLLAGNVQLEELEALLRWLGRTALLVA